MEITDGEMRGLADARAQAIEQREDGVVRRPSQLPVRFVGKVGGRLEQSPRLSGVEDEGQAALNLTPRSGPNGRAADQLSRNEPREEAADDAEQGVVTSGARCEDATP